MRKKSQGEGGNAAWLDEKEYELLFKLQSGFGQQLQHGFSKRVEHHKADAEQPNKAKFHHRENRRLQKTGSRP